MPSWSIHLAIAKKVSDKLKVDKDLFSFGSLIPDTGKDFKLGRYEAHYYNENLPSANCPKEKMIDLNRFVEDYKKYLKNPLILGYYAHLLTDNFCNNLVYSKCWIQDDNNNVIGIRFKNGKIMKVDVIIGGPPCQGFSTLGKRFIDDPRNKLFKEYVRIVNDIRPKFFVMENVAGILSMEKGKVLESIIKAFSGIGYKIEYRLLNAAEYGVPQLRERVIFIGTRIGIDIEFPKKTHSLTNEKGYKKALTLWDAIGDLPQSDELGFENYDKKPFNSFQKKMRKNSVKLFNHIPPYHNDKSKKMMQHISMGKSAWESIMPKELKPTSGYGNTYARLNANEPGMTITRNFSCISSSRCIHPYLNRGLTVREAARIQSYPDNYIFKGSKTAIQIQIGNSVPPLFGERIAETIKAMLDNE